MGANVAQGIYYVRPNSTDTQINEEAELGMMFSWTNSYDKSTRFQCAVGAYGDREIDLSGTDMDMDIPPVCFGSCNACDFTPPVSATVTFHADMTELNAFGWDPSLHVLELRGGMNGWGAGDAFAPDLTDTSKGFFLRPNIEPVIFSICTIAELT